MGATVVRTQRVRMTCTVGDGIRLGFGILIAAVVAAIFVLFLMFVTGIGWAFIVAGAS